MYARSTIDHYADSLPQAEKEAFLLAVDALQWETHGKVRIILSSTLDAADLGDHVKAMEKDQRWLFLTNTGDDLTTVYGMRYEERHAS